MNSESTSSKGKRVKRIIAVCEILVFFLFVAKILAVGGIIRKAETHYALFPLSTAQADHAITVTGGLPVRDVLDDGLANERKLMDHLLERQKQLESRENLLKTEEKKLETLKQEIVAKMENLRILEEKLSVPLTAEDKKFKDLAKVYEAAPPSQVGSILEKMDTKMAAAIISNMNNKKAGQIWGHISPGKAVEIAREVANFRHD
jgi:flagellar motility protein MotE (MotC chaperone)